MHARSCRRFCEVTCPSMSLIEMERISMFRQHTTSIRLRIVKGPRFLYHPALLHRTSKQASNRRLFSQSTKTSTLQDDRFPRLPEDRKFEEERYGDYKPYKYYPVHLGQTLASRYRVVAKLGYGTTSTVWLARDLELSCIQF